MEREEGETMPMVKKDLTEQEVKGEEEGTRMKRELGLVDGVSIIVGIIVGSGIFVSPKGVLMYAGSPGLSLIIWFCSGLLSLVGALCYAELGTMIPQSGGDYAYIKYAFGPLLSFLYLWGALLVIMPTGNAITALTFANYILEPFYPECEPPTEAVRIIAGLVISLLTAVNCMNVKWATKVQDVFSVTKVLALVLIIIAGVVHLATGHSDNLSLQTIFQDTTTSPGKIALSFYSGLFSFAGWNYLNFVTEELKEPNKNLPRAIHLSVPLITVIYLLANLAYFVVLSPTAVLSSNAVAVTFGNKMFGVMRWIMPFFVACSTFGAVNGGIFASSRLFFVGARNGHMPRAMSLLNLNSLTPAPCLVLLCIITLAMLTTSDVFVLINFTSFVESMFITMSVGGLLILRWKQPTLDRPIKVNLLLPVFFFLVCGFLVLLPVYEEPKVVGVGLAIVLSGVPVYLVFVRWAGRSNIMARMGGRMNRGVQKLFYAVEEEDHTD